MLIVDLAFLLIFSSLLKVHVLTACLSEELKPQQQQQNEPAYLRYLLIKIFPPELTLSI